MNQALLNRMRSMSEADLYAALYTDALTGVNNRRAFDAAEFGVVAIVDLDSLKYMNDELGHAVGDDCLKRIAKIMSEVFGAHNVYRLGGDEFAVIALSEGHINTGMQWARSLFSAFSYGVGKTLPEADDQLKADKLERELCGYRSPRGECPPELRRA